MFDDEDKLNRVEDMKSKLFGKNYKTEIEHRDILRRPEVSDVADSWHKDNTPLGLGKRFFMKASFFKKFFILSVGFFILVLLYASFNFFSGGNIVSNNNVEIAILGNTFTSGGDELPLVVQITNKNNISLDLVDLVIDYPKSSSSDPSGADTEHFRQSLGTIPAGAVRSENIKLTLFGEQGSVRPIKISVEYRVEGSVSIFHKDKIYEVNITSTPINLSVDAPTDISPNQDIFINIKETLNAAQIAPSMLLKVDYPAGFQFISAKPAPAFGNNVWSLGDLAPGVEHTISLVGKMVDVFDGEQKTFRISTGSQSTSDKTSIGVVFNSISSTLNIKKPFIDAKLFINGVYQREYTSSSKNPIQGQIQWTNNLDTKINDLSIVAKISGNAVNRKTVSSQNGRYDSLANSITWDKNSDNVFAEVSSGQSGSVTFSIEPLSLFSGSGGILSSPTINVDVSISGKQAVEGNALQQLDNGESKVIHIISDVGFNNKALYFSGPFKNSGSIPPVAEKETSYTIVWTLSNTSNNISKAQVSSSLPPWVRFVGPISPSNEDLKYNPSTKEIIWNVGSIARGAGITGAGREVSFQVGLTTSLSQVGSSPLLVNDAILTGNDDFANVGVKVTRTSLNTNLTNDSSFPPGGGQVIE